MCLTSKTCVVSSIDICPFVHFQRGGVNTLMSSLFLLVIQHRALQPKLSDWSHRFGIKVVTSHQSCHFILWKRRCWKRRLHAFYVFLAHYNSYLDYRCKKEFKSIPSLLLPLLLLLSSAFVLGFSFLMLHSPWRATRSINHHIDQISSPRSI
jgi:hypothetical protein